MASMRLDWQKVKLVFCLEKATIFTPPYSKLWYMTTLQTVERQHFICPVFTASTLQLHRQRKPFICPVFAASTLPLHRQLHHFSCPVCAALYAYLHRLCSVSASSVPRLQHVGVQTSYCRQLLLSVVFTCYGSSTSSAGWQSLFRSKMTHSARFTS